MRCIQMIFSTKKGQGLPLNVIILAALALIVLVVLVAIFAGRVSIFDKGVSKEGQSELIKMKISYGDCRPNAGMEEKFLNDYGQATSTEAKEQAKSGFDSEVARCKGFSSDKTVCESNTGCKWG